MELLEKLPALRVGNRRLGRAFGERAISVERREDRSADLRIGALRVRQTRSRGIGVRRSNRFRFAQADAGHATFT